MVNLNIHSQKIEAAILGALIVDKSIQDDVLFNCNKDLFYSDENKEIFKAAIELNANNKSIDLITISEKLEKNQYIKAQGGIYYISTLTTNIGSGMNIETHIAILKELFIKRKLMFYFQKGIQDISLNLDIFDIFNEFSANLESLFTFQENKTEQVYDVILKRLNEIENMNPDCLNGVTSGVNKIDENTGGWQPTDLIIIAGKTSMGKTAVSLYFAKMAALDNSNVLFFSLEMSKSQLADRLISLQTGINSKKIKTNTLHSEDWKEINNIIPIFDKTNFKIIDKGGVTVEQISNYAKIENKKNKLDLIIIDYMQLVRKSTNGTTNDQVAHISTSLKNLAKKLDCPVIALSQLKRSANNVPNLSDLRDSGAIEQDADIVLFVHRYDYENKECEPHQENLIELIFAKHRNGNTGIVEMYRNKDWSNFYSTQKVEMPEF